ncbi:hypothetical protein CCACVL1_11066 [Corchorus capsularis]|uniref:Uncharacterized protein n=1 Tax=Corchorus capsularis TaxID=210143 RepID=A0A1R3IN08_COCAP|nr:hypothetical protein CCACVL1_11066 [Corchorus capsularis]
MSAINPGQRPDIDLAAFNVSRYQIDRIKPGQNGTLTRQYSMYLVCADLSPAATETPSHQGGVQFCYALNRFNETINTSC